MNSYEQTILALSPYSYWKLSGTPSVNAGSSSGDATYTTSSTYDFMALGVDSENSCAFLDETSYLDYTQNGLNTGTGDQDFSINFWFKLNTIHMLNDRSCLLWKDFDDGSFPSTTGKGFAFFVQVFTNYIRLEVYLFTTKNSPTFIIDLPIKANQSWYNICTTSDLNAGDYTHTAYIDGVFVKSKTVTASGTAYGNSNIFSNRVQKDGATYDTTNMNGFIDEVFFTTDVLLDSEVLNLFNVASATNSQILSYTPFPRRFINKLIIDGINSDYTPTAWKFDSNNQVHTIVETNQTLDLERLDLIKGTNLEIGDGINARKLRRQAWVADFNDDIGIPQELRDIYYNLFLTQKAFWLQFDSEMSRVGALLERDPVMNNVFYTPTYPIAPYGYNPYYNFSFSHNQNVYKDGVPASDFRVDEETGAIIFDDDVADGVEVRMNYTWRILVRIRDNTLAPNTKSILSYTGSIAFEQVNFRDDFSYFWPNFSFDTLCHDEASPVNVDLALTNTATDDVTISSSISEGVDTISYVTDYTDPSVPSIPTTETVDETDTNSFNKFNVYEDTTRVYDKFQWDLKNVSYIKKFVNDETYRNDDGIVLSYADIAEKAEIFQNSSQTEFTFYTDWLIFQQPIDITLIDKASTIVGFEFELAFKGSTFSIDSYNIAEDELYYVKDNKVCLIKDGVILDSPAQNKATNTKIYVGKAEATEPFYESYGIKTLRYGGSGDNWGTGLTRLDFQNNFGVAVKLEIFLNKQLLITGKHGLYTLLRHFPKVWTAKYKVYYY